jgi:hypothetical protein
MPACYKNKRSWEKEITGDQDGWRRITVISGLKEAPALPWRGIGITLQRVATDN